MEDLTLESIYNLISLTVFILGVLIMAFATLILHNINKSEDRIRKEIKENRSVCKMSPRI